MAKKNEYPKINCIEQNVEQVDLLLECEEQAAKVDFNIISEKDEEEEND